MAGVFGVFNDRFLGGRGENLLFGRSLARDVLGVSDPFLFDVFGRPIVPLVTDAFPPARPSVAPVVPAPDVVLSGVEALELTAQLAPQPGSAEPKGPVVNLQVAFPTPTDVGLTFFEPLFSPRAFGSDFLLI